MDRIKKIEEIKVRGDMLLVEIIEKKSIILMPEEGEGKEWEYLVVLVKGKDVTDVNIGDIILSADRGIQVFPKKIKDKKLGIIGRNGCSIIVDPNNFAE